jgi:tRNA(Ile)-lysidine synthase
VNNLIEQVTAAIRGRKLWRRGARVLVAVSGGVDSMVLLHVLAQIKAQFGMTLVVAHFNHQLRGRASAADERLVRQEAARLGLPFRVGRGDVKTRAQQNGISIEMAARELRHQFLAATARRAKCGVVATAHHADDQVELFFLRLLRGAGGTGLGGMKWRSVSPADARVTVVRPLLAAGKEALEQFARQHDIRFRKDASNDSGDFLRNRVRHELLPLLRNKFQPALNRTVIRVMDLVGQDAQAVELWAANWRREKSAAKTWSQLPVAVQRKVLQAQLQRLGVAADFELIEALRENPGGSQNAPGGKLVVADAGGRVALRALAGDKFLAGERLVNIKRARSVSFGGLKLDWEFTTGTRTIVGKTPGLERFDANTVGAQIVLRHWRAGDRFQPIGMKSAVKLQDWFTNNKVPAARRRELVVGCGRDGRIFWVEGQRIGAEFKLTSGTSRTLTWRWKRG